MTKIRILYVSPFASAHARAWIEYFAARPTFDVTVVSSDPAPPMEGVRLHAPAANPHRSTRNLATSLLNAWMVRHPLPERTLQLLKSLEQRSFVRALRARILESTESPPDLVHVHRLRPEGLAAAYLKSRWPHVPYVFASWGQDFVMYGRSSAKARRLSTEAVRAADLFLPDNARDAQIAREEFGLRRDARVEVLPVNGGLEPSELEATAEASPPLPGEPSLLCMRGYENTYVRIRVLIEALARFREHHPRARLYLLAGAGSMSAARDRLIEQWARALHVADAVEILHPERRGLFGLLRRSDLYVSATRSDGLPISLLEALYLGMVPVVFDHDSTRPLLEKIEAAVTFDRIEPDVIADAWERALRLLPERSARTLRNRETLAGEYYRSSNLASVARLYADLAARAAR